MTSAGSGDDSLGTDDDSFEGFLHDLSFTPTEVEELDLDGRSQPDPASARIIGVPELTGLHPDEVIAVLAGRPSPHDTVETEDQIPDHLAAAIEVYSNVVRSRLSRTGSGSREVLDAQKQLIQFHLAAGNLDLAIELYTKVRQHDPGIDPAIERAFSAVETIRGQVQETASRVTSFQQFLDRRRHVAPHVVAVTDELTAQAVDNPAAARLRATDGTGLASPLPVSQVSEQALETGLGLRLVTLERGRRWRRRFADLAVIRSPLESGPSQQEHQEAVLSERYGSANAPLRDAIFAAGAFPEVSQVLLDDLAGQFDLTDRDVVIHCPYFLRNRPDRDPHEEFGAETTGDLDRATPQDALGRVITTSLGWGGAANVGALLARWWGWGYTAAVQANLAGLTGPYSFGDWNDDPRANLRQGELATQLIGQSRELVQALRALSQRVIALDHPVGAVKALEDLVAEPLEDPLALVVITMNGRRLRFVARHMLSQGGRHSHLPAAEIEAMAHDLLTLQNDLVAAVTAHSDTLPVVKVELHDHLDDGYAESTDPLDPVDEDFDSFCDTAVEVREQILSQLAARRTAGAVNE